MFADEARFGRMNRIRPCWAPIGTRPEVAAQLIREYIYLYGGVSPKDGTCVYLPGKTSCWFSTAGQSPLRRPCRSQQHHALVSSALFARTQSEGKSLG